MNATRVGSLPPIRHNMHQTQTNRSNVASRQSFDSQDQRITQKYQSSRLGRRNNNALRGSNDSRDFSAGKFNATNQSYEEMSQILDNSPTKVKKRLEQDPSFQNEMHDMMQHMEKMPSLRAKV